MTLPIVSKRPIKLHRMQSCHAGITLVELLVVILMVLVMTAITVPVISNSLRNARIAQAGEMVTMQMRYTRQLAMDQRRNMRITFRNPAGLNRGEISIIQLDVMRSPVTTIVRNDLPERIIFGKVGSPAAPETGMTEITAGNSVEFRPDGAAADSSGNYTNGVVYVSDGVDSGSMRATSLFGATGRVKTFRYDKGSGTWKAI